RLRPSNSGNDHCVPDRTIKCQNAPSERSACQSYRSATYSDITSHELVISLGQPGWGYGIGDECDISETTSRDDQLGHCGMHMNTVGDDLYRYPAICQQGSSDSWCSMLERRHGIEEMRRMACSPINGSNG